MIARLFFLGYILVIAFCFFQSAIFAALLGILTSLYFLIFRFKKLGYLCLDSGYAFAVYSFISNFSNLLGEIYSDDPYDVKGYYTYTVREYVAEGLMIQALGTWLILLGFLFAENRRYSLPSVIITNASDRWIKKALIFAIVCLILDGMQLPPFLGAFSTVIGVIPMAVIMLLVIASEKNKHLNYAAIALLLAVTIQKVLHANLRLEMILPVVSYFIGLFYKSKGSFKAFLSTKLIPIYIIVFLFMSLFTFIGMNRSNMSVGWERLEVLGDAVGDKNEVEGRGMLSRLSNINQLTNVVYLTEKNGYYKGETLTYLGIVFIPRIIWADKPVIAPGVWFALEIGRAVETENWYSNSINITIPGELFLNFGWLGLVIGSFIFGVFWSSLWQSTFFWFTTKNIPGTFFGYYLIYIGFFGLGAGLHTHITVFAVYLIFQLYIYSTRLTFRGIAS